MHVTSRKSRKFLYGVMGTNQVEVLEVRYLLSAGVPTEAHTAIVAKYNSLGGPSGFLGNATSNEIVTSGGSGVYQRFQGGLIAWSAASGAHEVHGAIVNRYNELGGPDGSLGLPTTDEMNTPGNGGRVNTFEHGLIVYDYASTRTSSIQGAIATKYVALGGLTSFLGVPTSNESDTTKPGGRIAGFVGGVIVSSAITGTYEVHGAIASKYNQIGGTGSFLGFPTSDEAYTPNLDGRVSTFQGGTIVYNYATGLTTVTATAPPSPVITPSIDVLTPPNFREGDVFTATVMNATPGQVVNVQVIGDGNAIEYQFPSVQIDQNGNATLALRMPYVLPKGFALDGRTIRVTCGQSTEDFRIALNEGQRVSLSTDTAQEGKTLTVTMRNGVGNSQAIIQLIHDNNKVVHEWGYMETDGSGKGTYQLTIPTVLTGGARIDAYGLRVIQGGVVTDKRITITEGFRIEIGAQKVREGVSQFLMGIRNAVPNAAVTVKWYLDDSLRATQTSRMGSSGNTNFNISTPPNLIRNSANEDTFKVVVTVNGQSNSFTFKMLVLKKSSSTPSPGSSQVQSAAPAPTVKNSASGVAFSTPAVLGVTSVRPIAKTENTVLAAQDPVVTIQDRMKHQLVILCYGADQYPGENAGSNEPETKPGFDSVYNGIKGFVPPGHILQLQSGNKLPDPPQNANFAYIDAINVISSQIDYLASKGQKIDSIVIAGYSWGGGMAKKLADWITSTYHIEISGLVYVDAVNHGSTRHQTTLPKTKPSSFLNIYQSIPWDLVDQIALGDGHIPNPGLGGFDGTAYYGRYREFDVDTTVDGRKVNTSNHLQIDNREASVVVEFINGVLNGWYGAHHS